MLFRSTDYYPEQIISVRPDVILCTYTAELADEIQSKTGIPTVAVPQGRLYQEDYKQALRIIGDVCGVEDRAENVISYIDDCLADLNRRTADIPDGEKPSVLAAAATFPSPPARRSAEYRTSASRGTSRNRSTP